MNLDSAVFYTKNIEEVIKFYKEVIGLDLEYQQGDKYVSFIFSNNVKLGIKKATEEREKPGAQTIFIGVSEIEQHYQKFKDLKFNFMKHLEDLPWGKEFSIADPDGNKVVFLERH